MDNHTLPLKHNPLIPAHLSENRDNLLCHYAGLAFQKLLTIKPIKDGVRYECDIKACWDVAEAMIQEKEKRDAARH
jgi:hypothetical protein